MLLATERAGWSCDPGSPIEDPTLHPDLSLVFFRQKTTVCIILFLRSKNGRDISSDPDQYLRLNVNGQEKEISN